MDAGTVPQESKLHSLIVFNGLQSGAMFSMQSIRSNVAPSFASYLPSGKPFSMRRMLEHMLQISFALSLILYGLLLQVGCRKLAAVVCSVFCKCARLIHSHTTGEVIGTECHRCRSVLVLCDYRHPVRQQLIFISCADVLIMLLH